MTKIEVYIKPTCPFCIRVLSFYKSKGLDVTVYDIQAEPALRDEMIARIPGASTVPQSLINDVPIGGCDEVMTLESNGEFDNLVA